MPETTPLIKAALNLRVGAGFDVYKSNLSNEQLKEIVLHILKFGEGERDWWLEYLEINTGLDNLTDYIFYPDLIGLDFDATLEQIADKIIADRK